MNYLIKVAIYQLRIVTFLILTILYDIILGRDFLFCLPCPTYLSFSLLGTISEKKNQPSRMRSVQTSVSGLETSARPKQEVKNVKFPDVKPIESGSEPDRSSVSELNELLNIGNETSTRISSRSDALKELDRKLEVR